MDDPYLTGGGKKTCKFYVMGGSELIFVGL
jgi:hypothetical protein